MEKAPASYSISVKRFWNPTLSLHFVCQPLYTKQPLSSSQSSQHLKALFLHRPSFAFLFPPRLVSRWFDRRVTSPVVRGVSCLPIKPKGGAWTEVEQVSLSLDSAGKLLPRRADLGRTLPVKSQTLISHTKARRSCYTEARCQDGNSSVRVSLTFQAKELPLLTLKSFWKQNSFTKQCSRNDPVKSCRAAGNSHFHSITFLD